MVSKLSKREQVKLQAEASLETFIQLVHPQRVLGLVHRDVIQWWTRKEAKKRQLLLMPRDHQKSALLAYRVAHRITVDPTVRILYISSTANLAIKQLGFIKDILTSDRYRLYWPEMVHPEEGKRKKWTESEIAVDHPLRLAEAVRDPTIFTAGLTTTITGLHADVICLDDIVVRENAYTEDSREKVREQFSLLASIAGTDSELWGVGTRYDPQDLYNDQIKMEVPFWNDEGEETHREPLFEVKQYEVENRGDGTGEFLWPRQYRYDGKWFGFDRKILAEKRALYLDQTQFFAQYYNNPNVHDGAGVSRDDFQYYEKSFLNFTQGRWHFKNSRLNVFAAIDFAYSTTTNADYTSIVVIGIDGLHNVYVLDIDRFKTKDIPEYFKHLMAAHEKWEFHNILAECTAAQAVIVNELKNNYIRPQGLALSIEEYKPSRHEGSKEERMDAILQHRYKNKTIWHYKSGNCQILEDEVLLKKPPHDDVKDALANAISIAKAPTMNAIRVRERPHLQLVHSKFGGLG